MPRPYVLKGRTFTNPVYDHDFPDPFVLKVGETYYAYATNANGEQVQTLTSQATRVS